jgi:hypothetical protein
MWSPASAGLLVRRSLLAVAYDRHMFDTATPRLLSLEELEAALPAALRSIRHRRDEFRELAEGTRAEPARD